MSDADEGLVGRGLDIATGLAQAAIGPAQALAARAAEPARVLAELALRPPLLPDALSPGQAVQDVSVRLHRAGDSSASALLGMLETALDSQVPKIADAVLTRLDLAQLIEAVLEHLDLTELARSRIDLARLTSEVIEEINLPAIIRESTSGVASDVVTGARSRAAAADETVARFLLRGRARDRDLGER